MSLPLCPHCNKLVLTTHHQCPVTKETTRFTKDIISVFGNPAQHSQQQEHLAPQWTAQEYKAPPWPLLVRGIARQRIDTDTGVGDTVHRILSKMGGDQFEWVMKRLGIECGCGERQAWLNAVYPYTDSRATNA
jgi:hypothetical protein